MHTEDQAAELYCPRTIAANGAQYVEPGYCRVSRCMAWRWGADSVHGSSPIKEAIAPVMPPPDTAGFWVKGVEYSRDFDTVMYRWGLFPQRGYCGLAGKPDA